MGETVKSKKKKTKNIEKKTITTKNSSCNLCLIATLIIITAISYFTYGFYTKVIEVPEKPDLDENFWWGPGNARNDVDTSIRPYKIVFSDAMQEQFRRKCEIYRSKTGTRSFEGSAWTYGIHSDALARIFSHWIFNYSFRERERYFNQYEHFKTNIQGLDIHFVHVKPKVKENVKVLQLLLLHGWLGSIREFYEVIPILTTPREGYDFVFELILPSLPGFAYSQASSKPGLSPAQIAVIMKNLMKRLGYNQFYVHGGDFGFAVGSTLTTIYPENVLGFHTNLPCEASIIGEIRGILHGIWTSWTTGSSLVEKVQYYLEEFGYMHIQGTKPDTIGIALNDSPAGLLAYLIDRFQIFTNPDNKFLEDGGMSQYNMTDLIDIVMMYWAPESITTSMRLYKESFRRLDLEQTVAKIPTPVPTWVLRLKNEIILHPDYILRRKYPNLLGSTTYDFGGHFAAFERPKEFADDIFLAVKSFLEFRRNK